jgi:ABC-type transport system substrate-binding protein
LGRDGWTGDYDDPQTNLLPWMAYREGPDKDARWYDTPNAKEFDRLMKAAEKETDSEKRFNLFKQAESTLLDDMPIIPQFQSIDTILIKPDVTGVVKASLGHIYFQYADVKTD